MLPHCQGVFCLNRFTGRKQHPQGTRVLLNGSGPHSIALRVWMLLPLPSLEVSPLVQEGDSPQVGAGST